MKKPQLKTKKHKISTNKSQLEVSSQSFSKYDFVKSYTKASNKEEQAVIIADTLRSNQNFLFSNLATKDELLATKKEISDLRNELKKDIANLRNELHFEINSVRNEMKLLESRIVNKIGIIITMAITASSTLIVTLIKLL